MHSQPTSSALSLHTSVSHVLIGDKNRMQQAWQDLLPLVVLSCKHIYLVQNISEHTQEHAHPTTEK